MCKLCEIKPVYEFTNKRKLCKTCYIHWFEKKFLYTIRKFEMIKKGEKIFIKKEKDIPSLVLNILVNDYSQRGTIKIEKNKIKAKILAPDVADDFAFNILKTLLTSDEKNVIKKKNNKNIAYPLFLFLRKEVLLYAKLKGINKKDNKKKTKIDILLNTIEKKHPEVKNALVKSYIEYY